MTTSSSDALALEVSDKTGMGEETMMSFIHQHLASILQPFADHVDQLHSAVEKLGSDLADTTAKADRHGQLLQENDLVVRAVKADLDGTKRRANEAKEHHQTQLDELAARISALEVELPKARADTSALDDRHRQTHGKVLDLEQELKGAELSISRIMLDLEQADERLAQKQQAAIEQLRAETVKLATMHQGLSQALSKVEKQADKNRSELDTFLEQYRRQRKKDDKSFKDINATTSSLNSKLEHSDVQAKTQAAYAEVLKEDLTTLQRRHEQTMRMQTVQERQQKESNEQQAAFHERLNVLKGDIQNVMEALGLIEGAANLVETVKSLTQTVDGNVVSIGKLDEESQQHFKQAEQASYRLDELDKVEPRLQKADQEMNEKLSKRLDHLYELIYQNEQKDNDQREMVLSEATARAQAHVKYMAKFDEQAEENAKVSTLLQKLDTGLDATDVRVGALEVRFPPVEDQLSKLGGSMNLTQEYWKGLTRGFQETHRKVAVDKEILPMRTPRSLAGEEESDPQRGMRSRTLPALTKTA
eukprot:gb/GFBE01057430.1/.p1 GENE.gb/GFBE01057430.1/~~gb/GFBE01057430.1/.p1  ORF type:complete len:533 (+),score=146.66 gb/GFBE01057430.1/:1-1599(+)